MNIKFTNRGNCINGQEGGANQCSVVGFVVSLFFIFVFYLVNCHIFILQNGPGLFIADKGILADKDHLGPCIYIYPLIPTLEVLLCWLRRSGPPTFSSDLFSD